MRSNLLVSGTTTVIITAEYTSLSGINRHLLTSRFTYSNTEVLFIRQVLFRVKQPDCSDIVSLFSTAV